MRIGFATFFEKKVAPKNFQREVFSAHSAFDLCAHTPLIVGTGVLDCPKK